MGNFAINSGGVQTNKENMPSIDVRFGPYVSVAAAHAALSTEGICAIGLTVGIISGNNITEYWYQGGTAQANLVKKQQGGEQVQADWNQTNQQAKDFIKNKPTIPTVPTNVSDFNNDAHYVDEQALSQAIEGKANKSEMAIIVGAPGSPAEDKATITLKQGVSATVLTQHQDISGKANTSDVNTALADKQDTINDLANIRSGAAAGATAQQPATTLAGYGITDAYTKTEVNGLVDTPHQEYVTVNAYASLPATGSKDTIYRVSNYNGSTSQVDVSVYSEYAWNGSQYIFLCVKSQIGEVFDISVYNNNAKYADLAAALNGGANVPQSLQKGGMSVKFIQSSDNKYVQYRLMSDSWSIDTSNWALYIEGVLVENPEWVKVVTDADDKVLYGIKTDGKFYFGDGCPPQVVEYVTKNLAEITAFLNTKVDKVIGKSLIDAEFAASQSVVENPEFMQVEIDKDGRIIEGITTDGKKKVMVDTEIQGDLVFTNSTGQSVTLDALNLTSPGLDKLQQDLINAGFNPANAVESISVNGGALPKNNGNVNLPIASSQDYGLMSPQDKIALGSLQPNINISGSGVTKNAASFNFLPTNTAADNDTAIASALSGGGTILVDVPGIYDISAPITISSNTTLIFGANTFVRMQADMYAVINAGAYTRVYDENISLIGLYLIANGHKIPAYDVTEGASNVGIVYGVHGYVDFFYVKHLYISDYIITDQENDGYGANICTFEDVVVERVVVKGEKDGLHFGRGKRLTVRDCKFACYDDACTLNAVDFSRSQPEVGWIDGVLIENCYDMVNPNHDSAGYFSRLMGGAWTDWESGMEVMLGSTVIVEENGVKRMYRVGGGQHERAYKFISTTKPSNTIVGTIEHLDEQTVTRTIGGVAETITMKIPWVLQQTQDVGYDGGCKNVVIRNIHLQKTRAFIIQYYMDDQWLNAIVDNAQGTSIIENITFDNIIQEYEGTLQGYQRFLTINCPIKNVKIINCYLKHYVIINISKLENISGLDYGTATVTLGNNTYAHPTNVYLASMGTGTRHIDNAIRIYGSLLLQENAIIQNDGANFITNEIV